MLKEIISISGRPGLYKLLATNRNGFIVESFVDQRRTPISATERVVSLREISVYTSEGDISLGDLLQKIYEFQEGKTVDLSSLGKEKQPYFDYFEKVLPTYDREMVHANEIKKILVWYNALVEKGFDNFKNKEEKTEEEEEKNESPKETSNE